MGIKKLLKTVFTHSCVYFTIITALYMAVLQIVNIDEGAAGAETSRILLFYLASLLGAIAGVIRKSTALNSALKLVIHYIIWVFAFYSCMLLPTNMRSSQMIVGIALFTLIYAIIMAVSSVFSARLKANREKPAEYKSQFTSKK